LRLRAVFRCNTLLIEKKYLYLRNKTILNVAIGILWKIQELVSLGKLAGNVCGGISRRHWSAIWT
jgi:hypothetical protein